jgi:serine acetyltransferase
VDLRSATQRTFPVRIGDYTFIGARCTVLAGVTIASRVAIGAGSTVTRDLSSSEALYAGSPASEKASLAGAAFFSRTEAVIWPEGHASGNALLKL